MSETNTTELWIPDGAIKAEERDSSDRLKIAIVGPQKGGKSRLAATAPRKPIYFWDFDDRLISVSGFPGVYGKTYKDAPSSTQSTAWNDVLIDMGMFQYNKAKGIPIPQTMVFDSMTYMMDRAMRWAIVNNNDMRRTLKVGPTTTYIAGGYDAYKVEMDQVCFVLNSALELGVDLICCFHERAEEAPDSTEKNPKYTGKITTHPPRAAVLLPTFNELWRVRPNDQGVYKVQLKPNYEFVGATCFKLGDEEEPDITKMVEKHKQNKGK